MSYRTQSTIFFLSLFLQIDKLFFVVERNLQPKHHFRRVFPDEKGDDESESDSEDSTCCDCSDDDMPSDDDSPSESEKTGLGQTEQGSMLNLNQSDNEGSFPSMFSKKPPPFFTNTANLEGNDEGREL